MDIATNLDEFLTTKFPCSGGPVVRDWCSRFCKILKLMLNETPDNRPKASEVWEHVSPVASIANMEEEMEGAEITGRENFASMLAE